MPTLKTMHAGITRLALLVPALGLCFCLRQVPGPAVRGEVRVAAAANLAQVLGEIDAAFERNTQVHVVPSFGATAQLAQQIESGAPFDVFMAADVTHVDEVIAKNLSMAVTKEIYARGSLVVYSPAHASVKTMQDLAEPKPMEIFIAKPELAPYGSAAVESMQKAGVWNRLEGHVKYAANIAAAKQYADTGNCDAAFTALSLVIGQKGGYFVVNPALHKPIDQALCILKSAKGYAFAKLYASFLSSLEARAIWKKFGYGH